MDRTSTVETNQAFKVKRARVVGSEPCCSKDKSTTEVMGGLPWQLICSV